MTLPLWVLIPLCLCAAVGVTAVILFLVVLAALGASHRVDRVTPLLDDDADDSGLLIEGPWFARSAERGR